MALSIALTATKGGVCKTTLTACLAVHAAGDGTRVAMLDMDPQGDLGRWWNLRADPGSLALFSGIECLADDIALLKSNGYKYIFVDTTPGGHQTIEDVIGAVDFAALPARASVLDLGAVAPTVGACRAARRRFGFVLSAHDPRWQLSGEVATLLAEMGPVLTPPIQYRAAYASAMTLGKTGPESQNRAAAKACREEIAALWASILEAAGG